MQHLTSTCVYVRERDIEVVCGVAAGAWPCASEFVLGHLHNTFAFVYVFTEVCPPHSIAAVYRRNFSSIPKTLLLFLN